MPVSLFLNITMYTFVFFLANSLRFETVTHFSPTKPPRVLKLEHRKCTRPHAKENPQHLL